MKRLAALALATLALPAAALGSTQMVSGTVEPQFGMAVGADGRVIGSASTIPAQVTRETVNGVEIVTVVPLK